MSSSSIISPTGTMWAIRPSSCRKFLNARSVQVLLFRSDGIRIVPRLTVRSDHSTFRQPCWSQHDADDGRVSRKPSISIPNAVSGLRRHSTTADLPAAVGVGDKALKSIYMQGVVKPLVEEDEDLVEVAIKIIFFFVSSSFHRSLTGHWAMATTTRSHLIGRVSLRAKCILLLSLFAALSLSFILGGAFLGSCHIDRVDSTVQVLPTTNPTNAMEDDNPLQFMRSKQVLLISHELTLSGGPLLLMELAFLLRVVDAKVIWITNQHTDEKNKVTYSLLRKMLDRGIQVFYPRTKDALDAALKSDLIILNTAVAGKWLDAILKENGHGILPKVLWWIHEMRGHYCSLDYVKNLPSVAGTMIDSHISAEFWKNRTHDRLGLAMPQTFVVHLGNSKELMDVAEDDVAKRVLRQHVRESLGIRRDDLLFAIINSVSRGKGQHYFLRAFHESLQLVKERNLKVPKMYAVVVGSDFNAQPKFENELRDIVSDNGLQDHVRFVNKSLTVVPYLTATDVLIQNSQGRGECFGRITIEAMAFQVPVLGTAAGGTTEIVVDGVTGFLHPEGKVGISVLAENIIKLATQAETRLNMGRNGYDRVKEKFLEKHMTQRIGDVLKLILQNSKNNRTSTRNYEK